MDDDWFDIEDVEVYEDDEMLQNMYRQFNRIWNVEDFEHDVHGVHDNDEADDFGSDQSSWLSEDSEDSWNQSDLLLLPTSGRNSPVNEAHIIYGKSINIIDLLHSRETGIKSHLSKTRLPSSLLAFTLHTHWAAVSPTTMLLDAVKLLGRRLYKWEFYVLTFLQRNAMERLPREMKGEALWELTNSETFLPITFTDIIHALLTSKVNLLVRDETGTDLLQGIVDRFEIHEDTANFIQLLIKQGLDIEKNGEQALHILCESNRSSSIMHSRLRVLKLILNAGLRFSEITKRDLITKFSRNLLFLANENAVEIVKLLLSHGCYAHEALLNLEGQEYLNFSVERPENFHFILEIAMILLENDAQVNPTDDVWKPLFVFRMLDVAANQPNHPSMMPLLEQCIQRGLDLKVTSNSLKNLMMGFCEKYKHGDLADIIRLLCSRGIDVNQVDKYGKSALIYLSYNYPICRKAICDAVSTLLQLNIDAKRADSSGLNALLSFVSSEPVTQCCKYKILKLFNESSYWKTLDLLVDAGIDVNQLDSSGYNCLQSFLYNWSDRPVYGESICEVCLTTDFPMMLKKEAVASVGISPFKSVLGFVERLLKAGAGTDMGFPVGSRTVLHYVCCGFEGEQLIALVDLLCKSGIDVNAKVTWDEENDSKINAIEIIKQINPSQVHLIGRLLGIMKPYGFVSDNC